ncbi:MAG: enoyl-CoA hydratase [Cycloclasticus sp. symbiont of Poecilosclerida sp. M]|nr:MAG: enoyl-CoA hydratase [Cycloclasticus sp. symbiont of Poecilosclerida sp. M]
MLTLPTTETLLLDCSNGRLYITLNRPECRNAMNNLMLQELHDLADFLATTEQIRVVILQGAGGNFCAGRDIKERKTQTDSAESGTDPARERNIHSGLLFNKFWNLPQTLTVVVQGAAMGGGFGLACLADLTLAQKDAKMGMPETTLGIAPAQIAPYAVKGIGLSKAKQMPLTGQRINGEDAFQMGVAHYCAESDDALEALLASVLESIEQCGPTACAATKTIMHQTTNQINEQTINFSAEVFSELNKHQEGREGHKAFVEKRKPNWLADLGEK